jgi:NTP pyrophosphatase (non-canonical NTP hydrolase)
MKDLLEAARKQHVARGYTDNPEILALGVCEEAGEVAAAVLDQSDLYRPNDDRVVSSVEHELVDLLIYCFALAHSFGIDLARALKQRLEVL